MGRHQAIITEALCDQARASLKELRDVNSREGIRLRAIISARKHGITLASKVLCKDPNALREWAKRFSSDGIKGLQYKSGRGRRSHVSSSKRIVIKEWIEEDPSITLKEMVINLKDKFDVTTSISAIHRILKKLGLSYITLDMLGLKKEKEHS